MSEGREKFDLDFGIEDTTRSAGESQLINAVFTGGAIGNPDDVRNKDDDTDSSTTVKTTTKDPKAAATTKSKDGKPAIKKEEDQPQVDVAEVLLGEGGDDATEGDDTVVKEPEEAANSTDISTFANLAKDFVGLGLFREPEEGEEFNPEMSPEEFVQLYATNKNRDINDTITNFLGRFGEDYKEMFNAVFVNGVSPEDYLSTFSKLQDIASLDMTQEASQEKVYREFLKRQGLAQDRVEARLQKAKAQGDLEDDSTDYHKILIEQDAAELADKTKQKEQKTLEERRTKQAFTQNVNKILVEKAKDKDYEGIPVTDQIAKETFSYLTEEKYRLPSGEPLTEFDKAILELRRPENAALKVKLALLLRNGLDLSKVKIKEKNDATAKAFEWATKGKQNASAVKNVNKGIPVKETESFI